MYEGTQLQRQIETEIRKQKDIQILAKESGNKELMADSQERITILNYKYKDLCETSGLPSKRNRMIVSGYQRARLNRLDDYQPKVFADLNYATLDKPVEPLIPINDGKLYKSSKVFKASKDELDLTNNENIKIYNGTDKLNISIYERANIKRAYYSPGRKLITTTGVKVGEKNLKPYTTLWHEMGHAIDNVNGGYVSNNLELRTAMYDYYQNNRHVPQEVSDYFKSFREMSDKEFEELHNYQDYYNNYIDIRRKSGDSEYNLGIYENLKNTDIERFTRTVESDYRYEKSKYYWDKMATDIEYAQKSN